MSDVQNPWEDGNNSKASANSMDNEGTAKIIQMRKPKIAQNVVDGGNFNFGWIIAVLILVWLATGIYQVQPNEQGVVLRFGKYTETTDAGLHYHLPYPIEEVYKVSMTQERSINLGEAAAYTPSNVRGLNAKDNSLRSFTESHMLTGDENIVDINNLIGRSPRDAVARRRNSTSAIKALQRRLHTPPLHSCHTASYYTTTFDGNSRLASTQYCKRNQHILRTCATPKQL